MNSHSQVGKPEIPKAGDSPVNGKEPEPRRFHILIQRDDDSMFSAVALNLPGAGSCGGTAQEAIENFREAARGILESYAAAGLAIPWKDTSGVTIPSGAEQKWITLDA